jgi:hypothetical protein
MEPRIPRYVPVVNVVLKFLTRRGVKAGPVSIITVAGRRSGRPHSTPVTPWVVDGKRYAIAGISTSDWSRNARAAGAGAPERTPEGFAAAVPHVAVFEVTPAGA